MTLSQAKFRIPRGHRVGIAQREFVVGNAHPTSKALRPFIEGGLLMVVVVLLASTWHVCSFVVAGPSMAETIVGEHRRLTCGDCSCNFRCAADGPEMPGQRAVCPNCGAARQRLDGARRQAADAIVVDRSAFLLRAPRRWELAAFRGADRGSQIYIKRIVGLPGEAIEVRHGDVYANGTIQRKSLEQQRAMAVPVYDSRHEAASLASRWLPDDAESGWRQTGSRYWRAAGAGPQQPSMDWLTYHHRRRRSNGVEECALLDDQGYNQFSPVTESYHVRDLLVRCRMQIASSPAVSWLITDGTSQFLVELDLARGKANVMQDGRPLGSGGWHSATAASVVFELALCDEQVLLAIDECPVLCLPYRPADVPFRPTSRPVAVGTRAGGLELSDLVLWRDIYYRPSRGKPAGWQDQLSGNEYYVLGDNNSASLDSRDWPAAGVATSSLVGKPLLAYPSALATGGPDEESQVPVWNGLRYIQ